MNMTVEDRQIVNNMGKLLVFGFGILVVLVIAASFIA